MVANLSNNPFTLAKKEQAYLRLALTGPSGSGKTWISLLIAEQIAKSRGGRIAFLDTEGRSARKYADRFDFDVYDLSKNYDPQRYITGIHAAAQFGYAVVVIDSLTHAWTGAGGVLEIVDNAGSKMGGNNFAGWSKGRPAQNNFVDALINAEIDVIGTMRTKTDWVLEPDARGKIKPVKKGLAPVQSSDFEYEFDVVIQLDMSHIMTVSKSRCHELVAEQNYDDAEFVGITLHNWLTDGEEAVREAPKQDEDTHSINKGSSETSATPQTAGQTWLNTDIGKKQLTDKLTELGATSKEDYTVYLKGLGLNPETQKFGDAPFTTFADFAKKLDAIFAAHNPPAQAKDEAAAIDTTKEYQFKTDMFEFTHTKVRGKDKDTLIFTGFLPGINGFRIYEYSRNGFVNKLQKADPNIQQWLVSDDEGNEHDITQITTKQTYLMDMVEITFTLTNITTKDSKHIGRIKAIKPVAKASAPASDVPPEMTVEDLNNIFEPNEEMTE